MGLLKGIRATGRRAVVAALIFLASLAASAPKSNADSVLVPMPGRLLLEAEAAFVPKALPRSGRQPIAFHLESKISSEEEHPPALREAQLDLDKHVEINAEGFSACPMEMAAHGAYTRALQSCGDAIVGVGAARVEVVDPASGALGDASMRLTIFKGWVRGKTTTLLFRMEPLVPSRSPLLAIATSRPLKRGRFGTQVAIVFPRIAGGNGSIVSLDFGLRRRAPGEDVAGIMRASCPDEYLAFRLMGVFADGTKLAGASTRTCTAAS